MPESNQGQTALITGGTTEGAAAMDVRYGMSPYDIVCIAGLVTVESA